MSSQARLIDTKLSYFNVSSGAGIETPSADPAAFAKYGAYAPTCTRHRIQFRQSSSYAFSRNGPYTASRRRVGALLVNRFHRVDTSRTFAADPDGALLDLRAGTVSTPTGHATLRPGPFIVLADDVTSCRRCAAAFRPSRPRTLRDQLGAGHSETELPRIIAAIPT